MKNVKSTYAPQAGDYFSAKLGYFDIYHSLELDEVQSRIRERNISGICVSFEQSKNDPTRWTLSYISSTEGDTTVLKKIDVDFFDYVEFEKIS